MPLKYFEIKKLLRSQIGLIDSLMNKLLKYMLLYGFLLVFFAIGKTQNTDGDSVKLFILLLIMGGLYRFTVLFEKINIKNLTIAFRKGNFLDDKRTKMLISDIELSLNKINSFANWSCGILATISIFITTTYLNFFNHLITKKELLELLISEGSSLQNSFIGLLGQLMLIIILFLLVYYLTVQAFTYDRRFVATILKSSLYIGEDDRSIVGFKKKLEYSLFHFTSGV